MRKRQMAQLSTLFALVLLSTVGCGSSGTSSATQEAAPFISVQPVNQSIPMGLSAGFVVQASGPELRYQWSRNGVELDGATASKYLTPATSFADTGASFTVLVKNSAGAIASDPATLIVTARAPKAGDLRFQQVDADSTVNGYEVESAGFGTGVSCPPPGGGGYATSFGAATGTGFFLGNNLCGWQFEPHALPTGVTGLEVGYIALPIQDYPSMVDGTAFPGFPSFSDPSAVVISLAFVAQDAAAMGFIQGANSSGFDHTQYMVPAAELEDSVTQEGLKGRVVTAIAYDGAQATYLSYGWTGDPSAIYEAKAVFATLDTATALAVGLANDGYIITASGSTQAEDGSGVILIGTRVQGDTMPRPVLVGDVFAATVNPLLTQGYAVVGVVSKIENYKLILKNYIGER